MLAQINHAKRHAVHNVRDLKRQGYKQIGQGAFSTALYHPDAPDVVIKVGSRTSRNKHLRARNVRDAFPEFAEYARTHKSKFYPRIYHIEDDGEKYIVVMKRYRTSSDRKTKWQISATAQHVHNRHAYMAKPDMRRFGRALEPFTHLTFDLHGRNIMQDERGTPILIDPVVIK